MVREWRGRSRAGLDDPPPRPDGAGPLWIGVEFCGDLSLSVDEGGRSGELVSRDGDVCLRYGDLMAFDATGRELPASLESSPRGAAIRIQDLDAVYPLTVDPLLECADWTAEGNQAGAYFGFSVATSSRSAMAGCASTATSSAVH